MLCILFEKLSNIIALYCPLKVKSKNNYKFYRRTLKIEEWSYNCAPNIKDWKLTLGSSTTIQLYDQKLEFWNILAPITYLLDNSGIQTSITSVKTSRVHLID